MKSSNNEVKASDNEVKEFDRSHPDLITSMIAGASAGIVVDFFLYPLDTIKTRKQCKQGFYHAGGYKHIYKGLTPALIGSAPCSSVFFIVYNSLINRWQKDKQLSGYSPSVLHLSAACVAEVSSAFLRVPVEIIKQRRQIADKQSNLEIIKTTLRTEGFFGFYRGTLTRELPFSAIQFPMWELLKVKYKDIFLQGRDCTPIEVACCGSLAGGVAGAITTPNDVVKTRIMLAEKSYLRRHPKHLWFHVFSEVYDSRGVRGLFSGIVSRVAWIMLGGFIFFGVYEQARQWMEIKPEIPTMKRRVTRNVDER